MDQVVGIPNIAWNRIAGKIRGHDREGCPLHRPTPPQKRHRLPSLRRPLHSRFHPSRINNFLNTILQNSNNTLEIQHTYGYVGKS